MSAPNEYDVLVIGAGVSGINASYRLMHDLDNVKFAVLEARDDLGGTWDFFKYPGLRSDSDMHTFGFPFKPWDKPNSIGTGPQIKAYLKETAQEFGIEEKIKYNHKVTASEWSTETQLWKLTAEHNGSSVVFYTRFIILGTGYYDYQDPLPAVIPGIDQYKGTIVHPQFWPKDLDYANKRVAIIGSGATAITLLPNIAQTAKKVTMIQRSPAYIMPLPQGDPMNSIWSYIFPKWLMHKFVRWYFLTIPLAFFYFCRAYPDTARWVMKRRMGRQVPKNMAMDPHFLPKYSPWEQRLCVSPDGDFYQCLHKGIADVQTGTIKGMSGNTVELNDGTKIEADILVTATGLKMHLAGGASIKVDGEKLNIADQYLWNGMMLTNAPNVVIIIGYVNSSWTLGGDATVQAFVRMYKHMQATKATSATPVKDASLQMEERPVMNLNSTYVHAASSILPHCGNKAPWMPRSNYFNDTYKAKYGDLTQNIKFERLSS